MTTTDPTVASLLAAVRDDPYNWDARRVLADALEECGYVVAANGQRWQARERKAPSAWPVTDYPTTERGVRQKARWWSNIEGENHTNTFEDIPGDIFRALDGDIYGDKVFYGRYYWGVDAAEDALACTLWSKGILVEGVE